MTRWMEAAWAEEGTAEIKGAGANPAVLAYFQTVGRPEITSDETSWCAAFVGFCLAHSGLAVSIPLEKRLLARAYLDVGTPIDTPRVGAIAVFTRGDPKGWQGHVGFVVGSTATHIAVLGGNQSNKVCVQHFPRAQLLGLRWPEPPATPADLAKAGSRTVAKAGEAVRDTMKSGGATASPVALPSKETLKPLREAADYAGEFKGAVLSLTDFAAFVGGKWSIIAVGLALFFAGRAAWRMIEVRWLRAEDHNTGANVARETDGGGDAAVGQAG